ncbi:MAG TPA: type I pullulanase [Firmicutes bacterium]|nr:type I pullulanase [Bacillota bacterium]
MKDTYVNAKLIEPNLIRVSIFSSIFFDYENVYLIIDDKEEIKLDKPKISSLPSIALLEFLLPFNIELGHSYFLSFSTCGRVPLDVSEATDFPDFDKEFFYGGNDLGAIYSKKETSFALWAPLASKVLLCLKEKNASNFSIYPLIRMSCGVFKTIVKGDFDGALYHYLVTNNEVQARVNDPYAKGSIANGEENVVIDFSKLDKDFKLDHLKKITSLNQAIIYEVNVRDMTISNHTDITNKGKFKGLYEKNKTTLGGLKAGFDYISSLGITHLQLMPVSDFKSVDELNPDDKYNWGYDPSQYFVLEGSYSTNPNDPYCRIKEFLELVKSYHEAGIRIVMDVVFNHVYEYQNSVFEKVVPNYYFRKKENGVLSNASGCGNDLATEKRMVSKLILDCCLFYVKTYGVDGFRFDLMGLIDQNTILNIQSELRKIRDDIVIYGEGWAMDSIKGIALANMHNYSNLPEVGFFNDFYRENVKKYCSGDMSTLDKVKNAYAGSCFDFIVPKHFLAPSQSLNYIECHDNHTYFDFLSLSNSSMGLEEKLKRINLANALLLLSIGVPFIHAGQEIGQSKYNKDNTYNLGDKYNKFSYSLLEERKDMYNYFKGLIELRKNLTILSSSSLSLIDKNIDISEINNALKVKLIDKGPLNEDYEIELIFNPNRFDITLEDADKISLGKGKDNRVLIPACSLFIKK